MQLQMENFIEALNMRKLFSTLFRALSGCTVENSTTFIPHFQLLQVSLTINFVHIPNTRKDPKDELFGAFR